MTSTSDDRSAGSLTADDLVLSYDDRVVIDALDVRLPPGRITAIVGPNACGKSTLLRGLGRIVTPASGVVRLDDVDVRSMTGRTLARRVGLLPQSPRSPDGITVADLVERGRSPHQGWFGGRGAGDDAAVVGAMRATGVAELADRGVDELSGGQRQRVWIAMILAQDTDVLLLDEPTTYLDMAHAVEVLDLLVDRNRASGTTVVVVLHDLDLACRYADHLIAMRDGAIVAQGTPARTVTAELVHSVYGVHARVITDPIAGTPMVVPAGRHHPLPAVEDEFDGPRTTDDVRDIAGQPHPLVIEKVSARVDDATARFVAAAPLVFMGSADETGAVTVTPRGGPAGFVRVLDGGRRVAIPERPGNRRVDTLQNVVRAGGVGLTFCVPTVEHVVRVNGRGRVVTDRAVLDLWSDPPAMAIVVDVEQSFVHCGRALRESTVWTPEAWSSTHELPSAKDMAEAARALGS